MKQSMKKIIWSVEQQKSSNVLWFHGKLKIVSVYSIIIVRRLMKLNRGNKRKSAENAGLTNARLQNNGTKYMG